jgi:hypothetical protein
MFYSSPELLALRAELAANGLSTGGLTVRYNPWDLGAVWVLDPVSGRYVRAAAADPALQGLTEYQWRVLKRAARERFDGAEHVGTLAEGRNVIRDVVAASAKKPSKKRRVRAARFLGKPESAGAQDGAAEEGPWADVPLPGGGSPPRAPAPAADPAQPGAAAADGPEPARAAPVDPTDLDVEDWGVASAGPGG